MVRLGHKRMYISAIRDAQSELCIEPNEADEELTLYVGNIQDSQDAERLRTTRVIRSPFVLQL